MAGTSREPAREPASEVASGDRPGAERQHFSAIYDKLRKLARRTLLSSGIHPTLDPTELVHEAWIKLGAADSLQHWKSEQHFCAAAAETMRHLLVDRTRRKLARKHGGDFKRRPIEWALRIQSQGAREDICFIRVHEALEVLRQESANGARVIDLKYFAGLSHEEVATLLEIKEQTVRDLWTWGRARLFQIYEMLERNEFSGQDNAGDPVQPESPALQSTD